MGDDEDVYERIFVVFMIVLLLIIVFVIGAVVVCVILPTHSAKKCVSETAHLSTYTSTFTCTHFHTYTTVRVGCSMADLRWNQPVPIGGYRIYWGRVIDYVSPTTLTTTAITTTTTTTATSPQQQPTADVGYHELTNRLNL